MSYPETVFFSTEDFLQDLHQACLAAKNSIDIEMFILEKDELSQRIMNDISEAVKRGIQVRILVDGVGSLPWIHSEIAALREKNIEVRVYNPLKLLFFFARWNKRNHRKTVIIDKKICYIGSFNFSKRYSDWRETVVKLENHLVVLVQSLFDFTWDQILRILPSRKSAIEQQILASNEVFTTQTRVLKKQYREEFLESISNAKQRVWLMSPYFNPPRFLIKALIRMARRGVDVKLVLPQALDLPFLRWLSRLYYKILNRSGVKIYEYVPSVLHAKMHIIDDVAMIGTGNLNYRSFLRDVELNVTIKTKEVVDQVVAQFKVDIENSEYVSCDARMPWYQEWIAKLLFSLKTSF